MFQITIDKNNTPPAIRVIVNSVNATEKNPFTVTVVRGKTVLHVALPRIQPHQGRLFPYWFTADTLCDMDHSIEHLGQPVIMSVASAIPSDFMIRVKAVNDFHLSNGVLSSTASPSEPRLHMYTFPEYVNKVDVRIVSDSNVCARIQARKANCPAFDQSGYPEFSDVYFYQSFTKFGGFSIRKNDMGNVIHITYTIESDDSICGTKNDEKINPHRIKNATITVTPVADEILEPIIPVILYIIVLFGVFMLAYFQYKWLNKLENNEPNILTGTDTEGPVLVDKMGLFDSPLNTVSHKEYLKLKVVKEMKYFNFLFFQLLGSILPQLTILFQNNETSKKMKVGTCYLNFLCSSTFLGFNCFNGIISSSSLIVVGLVNLIITFRKKIFRYDVPAHPTTHGLQKLDAPRVVFLLGVISLDVYTHSWTCISALMWIYSKRHGTRRWQQIFMITMSSIFGCLAFVENTLSLNKTTKIILNLALLFFSLFYSSMIALKYYYERPSGLREHQWIAYPIRRREVVLSDGNTVYRPLPSKRVFSVCFIITTMIWATLPLLYNNIHVTKAMLRLGETQVVLYLMYYIIQKMRFEKSTMTCSFIIIFSILILTFFSLDVFWWYIETYKIPYYVLWTPANSRSLNQSCITPGIDWSDMGHYVMSMIFIVFIVLMDYIDANIRNVPKKHIFVF